MINEVLDRIWVEQIARLQLGVAAVGAGGGSDPLVGVEIFNERVPRPYVIPPGRGLPDPAIGLPRLTRTRSGRFVIVFGTVPDDGMRVVVRLVDRSGAHVPRRLSIPAPTLAQVTAADAAHGADPANPLAARACRPALFPSVSIGAPSGATIVRGHATVGADGSAASWARVSVRPQGTVLDPWIGHADQNGEFVVITGTVPLALTKALSRTIKFDVRVRARPRPSSNAPVDSPSGTRADPLWHLPIERVASLLAADPVALGTPVPPGFTLRQARTVTCPRGAASPSFHFILT
jgi:hypothetical protein